MPSVPLTESTTATATTHSNVEQIRDQPLDLEGEFAPFELSLEAFTSQELLPSPEPLIPQSYVSFQFNSFDNEHSCNTSPSETSWPSMDCNVDYPAVPLADGQKYVDITEFLNLPQTEAAKAIGVPTSTLSKRWKESARNRKWPFRTVRKIDKEITALMRNAPELNPATLPQEAALTLGFLLRKRQSSLRPVVIRV